MGHTNELADRVWEGERRPMDAFNPAHYLVRIGWWYEPERRFVPITEPQPSITGSASPVYVEDDGE